MIEEVIASGKAFGKLKEFVAMQGGNSGYLDETDHFDKASLSATITGKDILEINGFSSKSSEVYLTACDNQEIGMTSLVLGGGRQTKESVPDLTVGIYLKKHLGDLVKEEDEIAVLYANDARRLEEAKKRFINAYTVSEKNCFSNKIIYEIITKKDV